MKELDVLAPSFALAMIFGYIVSKIYPPRAEAVKMIEQTYENSKKKIAINVDDIIDGEELNLSDDEDVNQEEPKIDPEEEER